MAKRKEYLALFKKRLKLDWVDEELLEQALTHSSFTYESRQNGLENNQRLEFLGDAVLELVISDYLYRNHPGLDEGSLTKLRASVVCEASLARAARELGLGLCLLMGKGEERSGGGNGPPFSPMPLKPCWERSIWIRVWARPVSWQFNSLPPCSGMSWKGAWSATIRLSCRNLSNNMMVSRSSMLS